ncbi:MAG: hypothetical protein Q7J57_10640 [Gemmobacter sp.]|nr:hypothetical protein [Gemmobacter sp.]
MPRSLILAALLAFVAVPSHAACYADYKAKRDQPLQLHYGVLELPDSACTPAAAPVEIARRIGGDGWKLLNVLGTFGPDGLDARRSDAGAYFLRY